jgi:aminoglycoside 6-adenylyltransferase
VNDSKKIFRGKKMRSEKEMFDLILGTAQQDERVRAVIMNGSRANPNAPADIFQDYDIVYIVTEIASFKAEPTWIDPFGERMIMQLPEDMVDPPPSGGDGYAYLIQFADGNRIDLSLFPVARIGEMELDSQSILLLDKDGIIESFPPPSDRDYLPQPPTAKLFSDCCNEFWWVSTYVAKGLWRLEISYAKGMQDQVVRPMLMKMLTWYIAIKTGFSVSPGKYGKYFKKYLEPELWDRLMATYADADYDHTWDSLKQMGQLFRLVSRNVADHFGFEYPLVDDQNVSAHLEHVRKLPKDAKEMY